LSHLNKPTRHILLAGGAEFSGGMAEADLRAIRLAGGFEASICILPTAAAPDNNHNRAGMNGVSWFHDLGAKQVSVVNVVDKSSANDPNLAKTLRSARLIYLLGGFPEYLGTTLLGSLAWEAALEAFTNGAVLAGSSAGAMVLCEHYYDPYVKKLLAGLNLVPGCCVLPHHNNIGREWVGSLSKLLPGTILVGIDEGTGMISEADGWHVYGKGGVTLYRPGGEIEVPSRDTKFTL
jgi:cyanophycinase